eukprot:jgi/Mesvir1/28912/Mv17999-RA.1
MATAAASAAPRTVCGSCLNAPTPRTSRRSDLAQHEFTGLRQGPALGASFGRPKARFHAIASSKPAEPLAAVAQGQHQFTEEKPPTPLLDMVNYPIHIRNFSLSQLEQLAREVRNETIYTVSKTGGHLGSSLGVVELTIALHHVFNTPDDKIIWDVGHQAYPHKILTGRRSRMHTIRTENGLSGFTNRFESEYDPFGAGHSSTSISAGLGMAVGRDLKKGKNNVIAIIGDGALTGGMAYEAMNNAGFLDSNMIVILNDNKQVSLPTATLDGPATPVGALSGALTRLQASGPLRELREIAKQLTIRMGEPIHEVASKVDEYARGMFSGEKGTLFEELGMYYIGPVNGHSMDDLVTILREVKNTKGLGPVLIHVLTDKGKGYHHAEKASDKLHGVVKFDVVSGKQYKSKSKTKPYTQYFAEALIAEAERDPRVVGVHAAMGGGTGMNFFQKRFPERTFDVGIAEQHAVTFCAGLATEGLAPFCTIYSTFLQRGYDQVGGAGKKVLRWLAVLRIAGMQPVPVDMNGYVPQAPLNRWAWTRRSLGVEMCFYGWTKDCWPSPSPVFVPSQAL